MTVAETSLASYNMIVDKLGKRQARVLGVIRMLAPVTNKELSTFLGWEINRITGRVSELFKKGLVRKSGIKRVDGFPSKTWEAVYPTELF